MLIFQLKYPKSTLKKPLLDLSISSRVLQCRTSLEGKVLSFHAKYIELVQHMISIWHPKRAIWIII